MNTTNEKYEALFTPWKIGNVEIKNRIVMCPMGGTSLFGWFELTGCHFDKEAAKLFLERAKNNVGLIIPGIMIDTFGTSEFSDGAISEAVGKVFDCRPNSIIRQLNLTETKYRPLAAYGHIGREDLGVSWEKTDKTEALVNALNA